MLIEIQLHDEDNIKEYIISWVLRVKEIGPCTQAVLFTCKASKICCCKKRGIFKYRWLSLFTVFIFHSTMRSFSNITRNVNMCALTCTWYSINRYSTITGYLRMDVIKKNTYYLFSHFLYSFQMNFKYPPLSHSFS